MYKLLCHYFIATAHAVLFLRAKKSREENRPCLMIDAGTAVQSTNFNCAWEATNLPLICVDGFTSW